MSGSPIYIGLCRIRYFESKIRSRSIAKDKENRMMRLVISVAVERTPPAVIYKASKI
jgi:hypothetical protein